MTPIRELTDRELYAVSGGDATLIVTPPNPIFDGVPVVQLVIPALPPNPVVPSRGVVSIIPIEG